MNYKIKYFTKIVFFLLGIFLVHCAPMKAEVSDVDLKKFLERYAIVRMNTILESGEESQLNEGKIFLESCSILRLKPELVLEKIKAQNPKLYSKLKGEDD